MYHPRSTAPLGGSTARLVEGLQAERQADLLAVVIVGTARPGTNGRPGRGDPSRSARPRAGTPSRRALVSAARSRPSARQASGAVPPDPARARRLGCTTGSHIHVHRPSHPPSLPLEKLRRTFETAAEGATSRVAASARVSRLKGHQALAKLLHLGDPPLSSRIESRNRPLATADPGSRDQPPDLLEREPEALRLLGKEEPAIVFGAAETVARPAPATRQADPVVVTNGAGRKPDAPCDLLDGLRTVSVDVTPHCQVKRGHLRVPGTLSDTALSTAGTLRTPRIREWV